MELNKILLCRFCLKICKDGFQVLEFMIENIVKVLLPTVDLSIVHEQVACNSCIHNLRQCLIFKNKILCKRGFTYNDEDINLNTSVMNLNGNATVAAGPSSGSFVCCLCMEVTDIKIFTFVKEEKYPESLLKKYFSSMDIDIHEDTPICTWCSKTLQGHLTFLNNCVNVEEEIRDYCKCIGSNIKGQIELDSVVRFMSNRMLKNNDLNTVKLEEFKKMDNNSSMKVENEFFPKLEYQDLGIIKSEDIDIKMDDEDSEDSFDVDADYMDQPETQEADASSYNCKLCVYSAEDKNKLKEHMRVHKRILPAPGYQCDKCTFNTRYKYSYLTHILRHESESEVTLYNCNHCPYYTKFKNYLTSHMAIHKNRSEVKMYKCELCPYETRYKFYLPRHKLKHQSETEVATFACAICAFQTKRKSTLKAHMLVHKDISEITIYKCESCEYQAKDKHYLSKHTLVHKSESEVVMYKCEKCSFRTRHKYALKPHLQSHKSDSEVTMYECDVCAFQTRHKSSLIGHVGTHKRIIYRCSECPYSTKHKPFLSKHNMKKHNGHPKVAAGAGSQPSAKKV